MLLHYSSFLKKSALFMNLGFKIKMKSLIYYLLYIIYYLTNNIITVNIQISLNVVLETSIKRTRVEI